MEGKATGAGEDMQFTKFSGFEGFLIFINACPDKNVFLFECVCVCLYKKMFYVV